MQLQADILGTEVRRPRMTETTALGAAYLAGLAVGVWPDVKALAARWQLDRAFPPTTDSSVRRKMRAQWLRAVERAKAWVE